LEDTCGAPITGYRAPSFSLVERTRWAFEILEEEGFEYDASVIPARHARGGMNGAARFPHRVSDLVEFPMSTMRVGGVDWPFSGGGYFRLFPYAVVRSGLRRLQRESHPAIVYVHPWEFDPDQPRLDAPVLDRFKHYVNLDKTAGKFRRLLSDFSFTTARSVLVSLGLLP
jgi:polysaccharide deacetylase family protein (PEP-CTERM system associated)